MPVATTGRAHGGTHGVQPHIRWEFGVAGRVHKAPLCIIIHKWSYIFSIIMTSFRLELMSGNQVPGVCLSNDIGGVNAPSPPILQLHTRCHITCRRPGPRQCGHATGGTPSAKFGTSLTFASTGGSSASSVSAKNSSKSVVEQR